VEEILEGMRQVKAGEVGRIYTPDQILAIAARTLLRVAMQHPEVLRELEH